MEDVYERRNKYQKPVDYEQVLNMQMARIAQFRSNKDMEKYEESVDTLIFMLPSKLRESASEYKKKNDISYDISMQGKAAYDRLWRFINEELEKYNLIFRSSYIKTYS